MAEAHTKNHDYHIIDPSPWPFIGSVSAFVMAVGAVTYFHDGPIIFMLAGLLGVIYTMIGLVARCHQGES